MDLVNTQDEANDVTFQNYNPSIFFFAVKLETWSFKIQQLKTWPVRNGHLEVHVSTAGTTLAMLGDHTVCNGASCFSPLL